MKNIYKAFRNTAAQVLNFARRRPYTTAAAIATAASTTAMLALGIDTVHHFQLAEAASAAHNFDLSKAEDLKASAQNMWTIGAFVATMVSFNALVNCSMTETYKAIMAERTAPAQRLEA